MQETLLTPALEGLYTRCPIQALGRDARTGSSFGDRAGSGWINVLKQTIIVVMSKVLPLSEIKAKLSEVVDEIVTTHERVTVTRNGRPVAVLVSTDDLEAIEETVAILSDPAAVREIEHGRAAIEAGDVISKDEVQAIRDRLRAGAV